MRGQADLTLTAADRAGQADELQLQPKRCERGVNAAADGSDPASSLRYSFGTTRTFDEHLSEEDKLTIDRLFPQVRLSAFSVAVARDTRDDLLEPQHGTLVSLDGTLAAVAIGSQVGYTKSYLQGFYYHRLGKSAPGVCRWRAARPRGSVSP